MKNTNFQFCKIFQYDEGQVLVHILPKKETIYEDPKIKGKYIKGFNFSVEIKYMTPKGLFLETIPHDCINECLESFQSLTAAILAEVYQEQIIEPMQVTAPDCNI